MFKRIFSIFAFIIMFSFVNKTTVYAANFTVDKANVEKGTVTVNGTAGSKTVKVTIEKDSNKYTYLFSETNRNTYPLQMGNGSYKITIFENVSGNEYKILSSESFTANNIVETTLYTNAIQHVDFTPQMMAIKELNALVKDAANESDKVDILYEYITKTFDYDHAKAGNAAALVDYLPVIDTIYAAKMGICYDYASLLAASLRMNGIPTKLQMGYCTEISDYHAWNEIYVGGSWFTVDATYDAQVVRANMKVEMKKSNNNYKVTKQF